MDKNFIVLIVAVFIAIGFSSCQKEGIYKPKEKITSIYYADSNHDKYLSEKLTWDGKMLSTIEHFVVNPIGELTINYTEKFKYDNKNRIERVEESSDYYIQYRYNGNKLEKVELHEGNDILQYAIIHYNDKKIDKIEFFNYEYDKSNIQKMSLLPKNIWDKVMPWSDISKSLKSTSMFIITLELAWDGDNVSKIKSYYTYNYEFIDYDENTDGYISNICSDYSETVISYTYDDKTNPLYGLRNSVIYAYDGGIENFSKNNIVSETIIYSRKRTINGGTPVEQTGSYMVNNIITYEGKVPTEVITMSSSDNSTTTVFYEYE